MERNNFKEYSVFAMMSKEEQQTDESSMRTESGTEAPGTIIYQREYTTGTTNIGLWPPSREHFTNSTCATVNITGFESARSYVALLASVAALLGKFFSCFIHTCTYNFATE